MPMQEYIATIRNGVSEVLFPHICIVCNYSLSDVEFALCNECLRQQFERANVEHAMSSSGVLLPNRVELQTALWNFDKGGTLQHIMHQLKYSQLTGVGIDIGRGLGWELKQHPYIQGIHKGDIRILPVPLHKKKKIKRGYNQAYYIAKGVSDVLDWSILSEEAVIRVKNTDTQTGFDLEQRKHNMLNAFSVELESDIKDRIVVIIDDVFTTGATSFELSSMLLDSGASKVIIATVAQA